MDVKLSIIIPAYNAEPYIHELLECINRQITEEIEVILIDDGSITPLKTKNYKWLRKYKQKNKGISKTRNRGLELANGEVIWFVDADDMIADNSIFYIISRLNEEWDYMDLSWKSLEDNHFNFKLYSDKDSLPNPSASTRVFRKSFIGDNRFPEKKDAAEDEHFTRHLELKRAKHICATEYMYFYRTGVPNSNSKKFLSDSCKTKRVAYYFNKVTRDMDYLIDEIKQEDEVSEVFLLTNRNDIPELAKYCQIVCPATDIRAMEKRGEPTNLIKLVPKTHRTQVVVYTSQTFEVGGLETFIYCFCKHMSKYYDITVLYDSIAQNQLARLIEIVPCLKNDSAKPIECDTLIVNRISDRPPRNVFYKKIVQMAHCIKQEANWHIPQDRDYIVNVSQASKDSFGNEAKNGIVIHNLSTGEEVGKALFLISALRVGASDKQGNDKRCIEFAKLLDKAGINYIWLYFGDKPMKNEPAKMHYCGINLDMKPLIAKADYLIQLSGSEAFSYSLLESLECNTPVIVTPLAQNAEMGIVDGQNAYIVPFDVNEFDVTKILNKPSFNYTHDNETIVKQWQEILGNTKPTHSYKPKKETLIEVTTEYYDLQREELMKIGTRCTMNYVRALELSGLGYIRMLD